MEIAIIAAIAENNAIGINNNMPWHLPDDLRYFKIITMNKPIIMGRKTFDALGKPLPGRTNIVVTRDKQYNHEGIRVTHSLKEAISLAEHIGQAEGSSELMIIGGAEIYRQALSKANKLYLTRIYQSFAGDAFFPILAENEWKEVSRQDHGVNDNCNLAHSYLVLEKR